MNGFVHGTWYRLYVLQVKMGQTFSTKIIFFFFFLFTFEWEILYTQALCWYAYYVLFIFRLLKFECSSQIRGNRERMWNWEYGGEKWNTLFHWSISDFATTKNPKQIEKIWKMSANIADRIYTEKPTLVMFELVILLL